jgi:hypothetical protein
MQIIKILQRLARHCVFVYYLSSLSIINNSLFYRHYTAFINVDISFF